MIDDKPEQQEGQNEVSRRWFSKFLAASGLLAIGEDPQIQALRKITSVLIPEQQPDSVVTKILEFEKQLGDRELTFEQAQSLVRLACEFRRLSEGKKDQGQDIANRVYIVRDKGNQSIIQLKKDYPNLNITDEEAQDIIDQSGRVGGWSRNGKIFTQLDTNKFKDQYSTVQFINGQPNNGYFLDFRGSTHQVECHQARPSVILFSQTMHEIEHDQMGDRSWPEVDKALLDAYLRQGYPNFPANGETLVEILTLNFKIKVVLKDAAGNFKTPIVYDSLHEFLIDYSSTRRIAGAGLPYTLFAGLSPALYANFAEVLSTSQINFNDLQQMLKSKNGLKEFYLKVAKGADQGNLTEQQMLDFIMPLLPVWQYPDSVYDPKNGRAVLKSFFPNLSEVDYLYSPEAPQPNRIPGCS